MTEGQNPPGAISPESAESIRIRQDTPIAKSPGAMLETQRAARGLSIADVAQRLKYGVRQIEALERDDYSALPGTTFVRGMIRGYAKLLELDSAPILLELDRRHIPAQVSVDLRSTSIPFPAGGRRSSTRVYGVMSVMAVVAALLVVYEWQFGGFSWLWQIVSDEVATARETAPVVAKDSTLQAVPVPVSQESAMDKTAVPLTLVPAVTDSNVPAAPSPSGASLPAAPGVSAVPTGVPTAIPGGAATVAAPAVRPNVPAVAAQAMPPSIDTRVTAARARTLSLQFERDSWVEIKQGNGRILMSQLNRGGTEQTVEGVPPFEIIIGNAPGVKLNYNSTPVDLRPHLKVDVARLTLQ